MDIDDPPPPLIDEPGRENAHEAGEGDRADAVILKRCAQLSVELFLAEALALQRPDLHAPRPNPFEACSVRFV